MHEILRILAEGVSRTHTTPPIADNSVKIAIITAISVVFAAAITAVSATFTKRHSGDESEQDYVDELVRRAEVAERRSSRLEEHRDSLLDRVDELERYCWRAGIDPNTGDTVVHIPPGRGAF